MGEMASLWGYEEHEDMDQLGQKLLITTLELDKLKAEARDDEMRKNKEYIKQLIHQLKFAIQERDEARNQLRSLLNNNTMSFTSTQNFPYNIPHFQAESWHNPLLKPGIANSSITESNSLSETYKYQSPVESNFDAVSSNYQQPFVQDSNALLSRIDHQDSFIIDNLVKGRVLPQKGKFLHAVLETGPLLETLLVAGPLPRWRNPPQMQHFQIPPVPVKGCDAEVFAQKQARS